MFPYSILFKLQLFVTYVNIIFRNRMDELSQQLRQFFVAKSFCDCSVMVSFQRIKTKSDNWNELKKNIQTDYTPSARFNLISDTFGNCYIVSAAIVDTDPKYSTNLSFYQEKYLEISMWWNHRLKSFRYAVD